MLALDDEKWSLLSHAYGKADDIPQMLLELRENFENNQENDILYGYLCHQNTTYSATFAAIPHLVELAFQENQTVKNQTEIVIFCGYVHALRDWDRHFHINSNDELLVADFNKQIETDYSNAITKIAPLAGALLLERDLEEFYDCYLFYAYLVFEGFENLSKIFNFSDLTEFYFHCPSCQNEIYLDQQDTKMVGYKQDYIKWKTAKSFDLMPAKIDLKSSNNAPPKEQVSEWVLFYAEKYDVKPVKYQIPYLFGTVICPRCDKEFRIIDALSQELFGSNYESL